MKTEYQKLLCAAVLLGAAATVSAQEDETKKRLDREMTLEREYAPTVQDANKVNMLPEIKEPQVARQEIAYSPFTMPTDPDKQIPLLPSGNAMAQMDYNQRRGYLNVAAGMHLNINGDFGYHLLSTEKDKLNVFFSHRSTSGNIDYIQIEDQVKAKLNDNTAGIRYAHVFDRATLKIGGGYNHSKFNYYGLPVRQGEQTEDILLQADRDTKQASQAVRANVCVEAKEDAAFFYLVDLDYVNFSHKYGLSKELDGPTEHTLDAKLDFSVPFEDQRVGVGGQITYFAYDLPSYPAGAGGCVFDNHAAVTLSPYYKAAGENWNLRLGTNVMFVTGDDDSFTVSPNMEANVAVADKTVLYLKADGRLYSNSAYETSLVNRYANPTMRTATTREWLNGEAGLKCGAAPGFWFNLFAGYKIRSSDVLFVPSSLFREGEFGNYADVLPGIDTKVFFAGANLKYSYQEFLDFRLKGVYNNWKGNYDGSWEDEGLQEADLTHVYGRPEVEINADVTLRPVENLSVGVNYYLATERYAQLPGREDYKMKNINELNLQVGFIFDKTFGAYLKVNNMLNRQYEMLYGYPMQGTNIMGGVNINF